MISPHRRGRSQQPVVQGKEKKILWGLGIIFVLALAGFLGLAVMGRSSEDEGPDADEVDTILDKGSPRAVVESGDTRLILLSPSEKRLLVEGAIQEDFEGFRNEGKLKDTDPRDDPELLEYLVNFAMWNIQIRGIPRDEYQKLDEGKVLFEPGPHRGCLAYAFGPIVKILPPTPFEGRVKEVEKVESVLMRTADGQLYQVLTPSPVGFEVGQWIQTNGVFYRLRTFEIDGKEEQALCVMQVNHFDITTAYPPITVAEIDPAWASEVNERGYDAAHRINERPFWLIMNYTKNLGIEGYRSLKARDEFEVEEYGDLAKLLAQEPVAHRFRFVSAKGKITRLFDEYMKLDNPGKIKRMDTAWLVQPSSYVVHLVSARPWDEYEFVVEEDFVEVEGVFYKAWEYFPARGDDPYRVPLLIVTDVRSIGDEKGSLMKILMYAFPVLAVAIVLFFFFLAFRDRRRFGEFQERFLEKKRERELRKADGGVAEEGEALDEYGED